MSYYRRVLRRMAHRFAAAAQGASANDHLSVYNSLPDTLGLHGAGEPVHRLFSALLRQASDRGAKYIAIEPFEDEFRVWALSSDPLGRQPEPATELLL